ncbi:MAG: effector-associated domain EAD1-containing protein [Mastigocoleus sp. MO_167.B18]|nr:effector-associated domain EAD1-containing protein [Mastigocoleus sp. MO_167.B18]
MKLSGKQRQEFRDALVNAFPSYSSLEQMVSFEFNENLESIAGNGEINNVAFNLIKWAEKKERLEELIRGACEENPGNTQLKDFIQRKKLIDILKPYFDEHKDKVIVAYKASLPDILTDKDKTPENAAELIYDSLRFPPQEKNKYSPLEKFVINLLLDESLSCTTDLEIWAKENIGEDRYKQRITELREEKKQERREVYPGLFVAILQQGESYIVKSWLNKDIDQSRSEKKSYYKQLTKNEQAEIKIDRQLSKVPELVRYWIDNSGVDIKQIHVFLPYELMNHPVDSWKTIDGDDETIGEFYEVIVRCSERMEGTNPRIYRWKTKGSKLKNKLNKLAADVFTPCCGDNHKIIENHCKQDDIIAVKITNVFQDKQPGTMLWKSAIPLALWIREKIEDVSNENELDQLMGKSSQQQEQIPLRDISKVVKKARLKYLASSTPHIGHSLCLLWDDPDLLPPEQRITQEHL